MRKIGSYFSTYSYSALQKNSPFHYQELEKLLYSVGKQNVENTLAASAASVCSLIHKNHFSCN